MSDISQKPLDLRPKKKPLVLVVISIVVLLTKRMEIFIITKDKEKKNFTEFYCNSGSLLSRALSPLLAFIRALIVAKS